MKFLVRILAVLVLVAECATAQEQVIDSIVAVVGTEVILMSEILTSETRGEIKRLRDEATTQEQFESSVNELLMETLEEGIAAKILYREASRAGVEIPEIVVENRVSEIRENYATNEEFLADLAKYGETMSDFRDSTRKKFMSLSMSQKKQLDLEKTITVSEADIAIYYEENKDDYMEPEQAFIRQIMLRSRRNTDKRAKTKELLETIRGEILAGADFAEMAEEYSELTGAEDGGVVGWQKRGDLQQALEDAAFALRDGEISEVVESQFGVYLIKVDEYRAAASVELKDVRTAIEPRIKEKLLSDQYDRWMNDLRAHSNVRILLKRQ
mgnify:CR=1 FL=1